MKISSKISKYSVRRATLNYILLEGLNKYERVMLCDMLRRTTYNPGQTIVRQSARGNEFFIVEEVMEISQERFSFQGEATCMVHDEEDRDLVMCRYSRGGYFGELALLGDGFRKASVFAHSHCTVVSIEKETFDR